MGRRTHGRKKRWKNPDIKKFLVHVKKHVSRGWGPAAREPKWFQYLMKRMTRSTTAFGRDALIVFHLMKWIIWPQNPLVMVVDDEEIFGILEGNQQFGLCSWASPRRRPNCTYHQTREYLSQDHKLWFQPKQRLNLITRHQHPLWIRISRAGPRTVYRSSWKSLPRRGWSDSMNRKIKRFEAKCAFNN